MTENPEKEFMGKKPYGWIGAVVVVAIIFFSVGYIVHTPSASTPTTTKKTTPTTNTTAAGKNVTITFYESLAPSEEAYFQNVLVPAFEAKYTNITVAFANLPSNGVPTEIQTLEKSGQIGATVAGLDNLAVGQVIYSNSGNLLMNLTNISGSMMPTTLIPAAVKMVNYEKTVFGGVYFFPFRANLPLTFYNKTAFAKAGITSAPTNDAQLMSDAKALKNAGFSGPIMVQGGGTNHPSSTGTELYQWMVQYGGNPFVLNSTADLQAWDYLYNLSTYFSPDYQGGYWGSYAGLANGQYQILDYQWPYVYPLLTNQTFQMSNSTLGVYGGPAGPVNGNHLLGGDVLVIPKGATHVGALELLIKYLLSPTAQKGTLLNLSWVAVNSQAYSNLPKNFSAVGNALESAINGGIFLRNPTPWITQWNTYAAQAWDKIIGSGATLSQIPGILSTYNHDMYTFLVANYGQSVANTYESGGYGPISV